MRSMTLIAALSTAISACPQLLAQSPVTEAALLPSEALIKPASSSISLAASASLPEAPMPAGSFFAAGAAISAVPCAAGDNRPGSPDADSADQGREPCLEGPNPYQRFLNTTAPAPLTPGQKALLAVHDMKDPGNLATILGTAAFTVGANAHTAYGPGWTGFRRNVGYSFTQDATGEFFGTFLIPSVTHEDPHYHRMPHASIAKRTLHAVSRTVMAQGDDGKLMPNYATLLTYPICTELSNLYVPGVNDNGPSTARRIMVGYATDPVDNLITEFLPDVARRIHVRVIFVQRVLNQVSSDQYSLP